MKYTKKCKYYGLVKKGLFILFATITFSSMTYSQTANSNNTRGLIKEFGLGFGLGPENAISGLMPKLSLSLFWNKWQVDPYSALEFTPWIASKSYYSLNLTQGIKYSITTLESSISLLWSPNFEDSGRYVHGTVNPKLGFKFWRIWIRGGPSIFLFKHYDPNPPRVLEGIKIGKLSYNFEIMITQRID